MQSSSALYQSQSPSVSSGTFGTPLVSSQIYQEHNLLLQQINSQHQSVTQDRFVSNAINYTTTPAYFETKPNITSIKCTTVSQANLGVRNDLSKVRANVSPQ